MCRKQVLSDTSFIRIASMNDTAVPAKRMSWFGTTFWVVVGGLLLLNISVFIECFDRLTIQQCLFRLDFRYWLPALMCPLWWTVGVLLFDTVTLRRFPAPAKKRQLHYITLLFSVKVCLILIVVYQFMRVFVAFHSGLFWWYPANLLLLAVFLKKWAWIYYTREQAGIAPETLNVRKTFLIMSITLASELSICNILLVTNLIRLFSVPLWYWFGLGVYSHWAAAAFILICLVTGLTLFVCKEWLMAIRQARRVNPITNNPQQSESTS